MMLIFSKGDLVKFSKPLKGYSTCNRNENIGVVVGISTTNGDDVIFVEVYWFKCNPHDTCYQSRCLSYSNDLRRLKEKK